jgi:hypothetical protein
MNNVDPDTQRWVLASLKEEEKKVKWMGRGKGGGGGSCLPLQVVLCRSSSDAKTTIKN